jgi:CHAT domain-containing protein
MWRIGLATALLLLPVTGRAQSAAPPRSTADILAILEEHKPDPVQLKRLREIADRQPPAAADRLDLGKFYVERGRAAGELGMLQQQLDDLRKASELLPSSDPEQWFVFIEAFVAEYQSGDYANALKKMAEAPRMARLEGQQLGAWTGLASLRAQTGDLPGARSALSEAEGILSRLQSAPPRVWGAFGGVWGALVARSRAQILRFEGKFAEAETINKDVLAAFSRYIDTIPGIQAQGFWTPTAANSTRTVLLWEQHHQMPVLLEQGKLAEAELLMRGSLQRALRTFGRYSSDTATILVRLATVLFEQGRYSESTALAKAAVDAYQRIGAAPYSVYLAQARRDVGSALVEEGKFREAVAEFEAMGRGLEKSPSFAESGMRGENAAWIYALTRVGRSADAVDQARRLYERERKTLGDDLYGTVEARGFLALALAADRKHDEALREFRAAVPRLLETASDRASDQGLGAGRTQRLTRILEAYVALLGDLAVAGRSVEGLDPAAEAFRIADVARGSSVQRALTAASARASIRDAGLAALAREEQDAAQRIGSLAAIMVDLLSRPADKRPAGVIEKMRDDIEGFRKRRGELKREIEKRYPEYANLIDPKPVPLDAARRMLLPGEALVVLYGTEDRTLVWVVPADGAVRFQAAALGRAERDALVARLRTALDVGDVPLERFPALDLAASHRLYSALLAPVEPTWRGAQSLLVVPHGSLAQVPFSLLVTQPAQLPASGLRFEGYRKVPWLIRQAAVTQLPSVNTFASLRAVKRAQAPTAAFAGFGDPVFRPQQVAQASGLGTRGFRLRSAAMTAEAARAASARLAQLAPLPDTAEELQGIAQAIGASLERDVFLGAKASEQSVKTTDLSDRRVIAFATHGLIPGELDGLTQPALALSNPQVTGEKDADGLLTMDEVLALRLNADWIVLSACNTASGGGPGDEALSGLGRAFFYAGARALLVSNWPVETVSAKLLTTDIFRRQAQDPKLPRAEALRRAMLQLIDGGTAERDGKPFFSYAHPMFWAPFSLVGDGG